MQQPAGPGVSAGHRHHLTSSPDGFTLAEKTATGLPAAVTACLPGLRRRGRAFQKLNSMQELHVAKCQSSCCVFSHGVCAHIHTCLPNPDSWCVSPATSLTSTASHFSLASAQIIAFPFSKGKMEQRAGIPSFEMLYKRRDFPESHFLTSTALQQKGRGNKSWK